VRGGYTEFQYRTRPTGLGYVTFVFAPWYWQSQTAKEKAMRRIPTPHVKWIATRLSQLSNDQIGDAFDAAGYDERTRNAFVAAIRARINELTSIESVAVRPRGRVIRARR
jgi:hypothetical protein